MVSAFLFDSRRIPRINVKRKELLKMTVLLNFAHGDIIMVGAYMSWFVMNQLGLGPVTAVCASIITCTLLGVVIEKIAYTPLRSAPRLSLLITAIGVSFFLEYTAELILGSGAKVIPSYFWAAST